MELSEKLLNLRKANDLTQEQLAEKINVSRQAVSKWESGQSVPELDKITIQKKEKKKMTILGCIAIYLVAFSVMMLLRQLSWTNDFLWDTFPGLTLEIIIFCVATAIAILFYLKSKSSPR